MGLIDELIGTLQEANLKGGEADAALNEVIELLQRAQAVLTEAIQLDAKALGDSGSGLVVESLGGFTSAQNQVANTIQTVESMQAFIRGATEHNTMYIEHLMS